MTPPRKIFLCAACALVALVSLVNADPSDKFLRAYMAVQNGERLEREDKPQEAATQFRLAQRLLDEIREENPEWQPLVVQYRSRKTAESLSGVEALLAAELPSPPEEPGFQPLPAGEAIEGPLPGSDYPAFPPLMESPTPGIRPDSSGDFIDTAMRELRQRLQQLELDLNTSRREAVTMRQERDQLARQLASTDAELRETLRRLNQSLFNETELRAELSKVREEIASASESEEERMVLRERATVLEAELANAIAERQVAEDESDDLMIRLVAAETRGSIAQEQRDAAQEQRDTALAELAAANERLLEAGQLAATNLDLLERLAASEARLKELSETPVAPPEELEELRLQIEELGIQLAAARQQDVRQEETIEDLREQLRLAEADMESLSVVGADPAEQQKLLQENAVLRQIITRELQAQTRREEARQMVLEELGRLEVQSGALLERVDFLSEPTLVLTDEEKALFRDSSVDGQDADLSIAVAAEKPDAEAAPEPTVETDRPPAVPLHLEPLAREAREFFQRGEYAEAERMYEKILADEPNNLYALSNLGVVRFRSGRLKAAELTFKKAIAMDPDDSFSHNTLGIVYYRQGRLDDAIDVLTRAIALNPQNPVAHNYLGITASQKGWQEAAQKELQAAIELNPNYADAHFNLAVVYAVADPPAKEMSRRHYSRAIELGAEPDPSLEAMIQ